MNIYEQTCHKEKYANKSDDTGQGKFDLDINIKEIMLVDVEYHADKSTEIKY